MRIMIADDDRLIRFYTRSLIEEIMTERYDVIEADNGRSLVDLCMKQAPDLAFVDIKMPYMDGVSAIEQLKPHCPNTVFVILTAFADFSFAKRSIGLGVTDYLLKPVERDTLALMLQDLKLKIKQKLLLDNLKFQHNIISLFNNPLRGEKLDHPKAVAEDTLFLYMEFFIFPHKSYDMLPSIYAALNDELTQLADNILASDIRNVLFQAKSGNLAFVVQATESSSRFIINSLNIMLQTHADSCCMSCLSASSASIVRLIEQAALIQQRHYTVLSCKPGKVHAIEAALTPLNDDDLAFLKLFHTVIIAFMDRNEPEFSLQLKQIVKTSTLDSVSVNPKILQIFASSIMGQSFNEPDLKRFVKKLLESADSLTITKASYTPDKIDLIKMYLDAHYMNDISITTIAEQFNLSPNYLSRLFHERIGIKFTDYLAQVRIYNAKLYLAASGDVSVKDVSSLVGYNSPRYFSNIFYKMTNMYPSDYRKSLQQLP